MRSLICACLVALLLLLCVGAWAVFETARVVQGIGATVQALPAIIDRHAEAAVGEIRAARADVRAEVRATRREALHRIDSLERLVDAHAGRIEGAAVAEIQSSRVELLDALRPVTGEAVNLMAVYRELPASVGARLDPWTDCTGNGACWQAQFTATLGATRATLGQVARTAPAIAASMERSSASTEKATAATAAAMTNLAEISRPLPRWLRVPLQIMGPTAPLWVPLAWR